MLSKLQIKTTPFQVKYQEQSNEIQQELTGPEIFQICVGVIFDRHYQSIHYVNYGNSTQFPDVEVLWRGTVPAEFLAIRPKLCGYCAFPQNFHTRKLGGTTIFFEVFFFFLERRLDTRLCLHEILRFSGHFLIFKDPSL